MGSTGEGGGGGGAPPPLSVECCMCGDHGLSRELFRCRSCQFRYQHKYCSDRYPKAEHYRVCNWCLRDEAKRPAKDPPSADNSCNSPISSSTTTSDNNNNNNGTATVTNSIQGSGNGAGSSGTPRAKLQRGDYSSHLNKPVKKQRAVLERSASEVIVRVKSEEMASSPRREAARGRQGFRGKIRRYRLLEEVSS